MGRFAQLAVAASLLATIGVYGASGPPQSASRVIYVNAIDTHQAPVTDLGVSDFVVKEDGRPRDVVSVEPATVALQMVILVDDNGTGIFRYGLAAMAQRLQGRAVIALRVVTNQIQTIVDYTPDASAWLEGINRVGTRPATPEGGQLLEGIFEAARDVRRREALRPVILALTVGGDEQSPRLSAQVLDELSRSRAALHVIFVDSPTVRPPRTVAKPSDLLEDNFNLSRVLADGPKQSGGRRRDVLATGSVQVEVQQAARDLLSQYAITYTRTGTGNPRRLEVTSPRSGVTVVAPTRLSPGSS